MLLMRRLPTVSLGRISGLRYAEEALKAPHHTPCLHASLLKQGLLSHTSIANTVLRFYFRHGQFKTALAMLRSMATWCRDSVSWNIVVHGFISSNHFEKGLRWFLFARRCSAFEPNVSTLVLLLRACAELEDKDATEQTHAYLMKTGFLPTLSIYNSLLRCYTVSELHPEKVFHEMPEKDVVSWSLMIGHFVKSGDPFTAMGYFMDMTSKPEIELDGIVLVTVLNACAKLRALHLGASVHGVAVRQELDDVYIKNALIDSYSKCGSVDRSYKIFNSMNVRNQVSWNSMLSGLLINDNFHEGIDLVNRLTKESGETDDVTFVNILKLSKHFYSSHWAKMIHCCVVRWNKFGNDLVINSLIDAYASCNLVELAWEIFTRTKKKDVVICSTMISGLGLNGKPHDAIGAFGYMLKEQLVPNSVTIINLVIACVISPYSKCCKWVHGVAYRWGYASEVTVGTAILNMYSKCGDIVASRITFEQILSKNLVTFSAMIDACATNGQPHEAFTLMTQMGDLGIKPNAVTILSVLSACRHGGLIQEGLQILNSMADDWNIEPQGEHYSCVVDMLCRSGIFNLAGDLMEWLHTHEKRDCLPNAWGALLSACRSGANFNLGEEASSRVLKLNPFDNSGYLLSSSIYALHGAWESSYRMRLMALDRGVNSVSGYSLLNSCGKLRKFVAGDKSRTDSLFLMNTVTCLHEHMNSNLMEDLCFA